jgi:hypothetical protein
VAVSDRNTATRSAKKVFYIQNRPTLFLLHLGCLKLHFVHSSVATGLCSFFWKIAKENPSKKQLLGLAIFQKNRAKGFGSAFEVWANAESSVIFCLLIPIKR